MEKTDKKTDRIRYEIESHINTLFLVDNISQERLLNSECNFVDFAYMKIQMDKSYILNIAGVDASELTAEAVISAFAKDLGCSRNEVVSTLSEYIKSLPEPAWQYVPVDKTISPEEAIDFILQKHFK